MYVRSPVTYYKNYIKVTSNILFIFYSCKLHKKFFLLANISEVQEMKKNNYLMF